MNHRHSRELCTGIVAAEAVTNQPDDLSLAASSGAADPRAPLDWARTQVSLGAALEVLGERECGTARLEQAVEASTYLRSAVAQVSGFFTDNTEGLERAGGKWS